jgi:hypothetical protein
LYPGELTAFFAALAWVFLVVGGSATLKTTQLAFAGGVAHAWRCHGAGGCETVSFGTNDLCHVKLQLIAETQHYLRTWEGAVFL